MPVTVVEAVPAHKVLRAGYFSPYIDQARPASDPKFSQPALLTLSMPHSFLIACCAFEASS